MRKIVLLILALCATMMVQAQIPAEVKTVLEKCGKVMENPRGLMIDMKMHMSMSVLSFNGTMKLYSKGEKSLMTMTMKLMGKELLTEEGYDGVQEWTYTSEFGKDTLVIKKAAKKSKGDYDLDFDLDKEYKTAKMKVVKDRYYEVTFTNPISKDVPKSSVMVIDKNNYSFHEFRVKEGMLKMKLTATKITVGVSDQIFVLDLKKYPNAKVIRK